MSRARRTVRPARRYACHNDDDCIRLFGALAGEILALPPELRIRVDGFFRTHQDWLGGILKRGVARGEFTLAAPPAKAARFVSSALLVKRTTDDAAQLCDVITAMNAQFTSPS